MAALIAGLLAFAAVTASIIRIHQLQGYYAAYKRDTQETDTSTSRYPPLQSGSAVYWLTTSALVGLPMLFVVAWTVILIVQFVKSATGSP